MSPWNKLYKTKMIKDNEIYFEEELKYEDTPFVFISMDKAKKIGKVMDVLCEINLGAEETKSGVLLNEATDFLMELSKFDNIRVCGLMAIPPVLKDIPSQKEYFKKIMDLYLDISRKKIDNISMSVLSIGMSSDFELAIEQGSNLVRIGTAAFGKRT